MRWLNVAVTPHFSWPKVPIALSFEGQAIVLSPETEHLACRASLEAPEGTTFETGGTTLSRFFSRLAWSHNAGLVEHFHGGSNHPTEPGRLSLGKGRRSGWAPVEPPQYIYLPRAEHPDADLALALYREGLSVNSTPFQFLSLYKVLNVRMATGQQQEHWINAHLDAIWYQPAVDRLKVLREQHKDVGHYLYVQGRCAVAHAHGSPLVNPDHYAERKRLEDDLRLMRELAALYIEQELGILTASRFFKTAEGPGPELLWRGEEDNGRVVYRSGPWPSNWLNAA